MQRNASLVHWGTRGLTSQTKQVCGMNDPALRDRALSKVPEVTLVFWIIKIAATTLGETGGDTVTMTLNWGYLTGTAIFLTLLIALVGQGRLGATGIFLLTSS